MDEDAGPSLLILYGSQTGNAQDVAERVAREARRRHYRPRLFPADAYMPHVAQLPIEAAVVFIVSTTGQGDPPDNVTQLWKFLRRKSLPPGSLGGVAVAIFGLGDSGYAKYNVMAKLLYRRMEALGASPLVPLGLGDDQHRSGHKAALDPWLPRLWTALRGRFPLQNGLSEPAPDDASGEPSARFRVAYLACPPLPEELPDGERGLFGSPHEEALAASRALDAVDAAASGLVMPGGDAAQAAARPRAGSSGSSGAVAAAASPNYSAARPCFATLRSNQRVTAEAHFQDVRMLDLDWGGCALEYAPGGVIAVWPQQQEASVQAFMQRCGLDPAAWVRIEPAEAAASAAAAAAGGSNGGLGADGGAAATVRVGALIAGALDVDSAVPRRLFFEVLRRFAAPGGAEQERLAYFASPEGRDDLHEYARREGRTALEVLADFRSALPPLEWLLSCVPRLRPRRFSVASSQRLRPAGAQLLVAVVDWKTPGRRRRRGLCSSWLAGLAEGAAVPVWAEPGALRLPADPSVPLVMVGPGTGLAPFRSFLQDRLARRDGACGESPPPAPCVLVFGCRSAAADFYCREELGVMQRAGVLGGPGGGLIVAFSRDQPSKVYVTHRIREEGAALWAALQGGAAVYVAGSANKMPAGVAAAFRDVAADHGGLGAAGADKFMKQLEAAGRYQVEAWS